MKWSNYGFYYRSIWLKSRTARLLLFLMKVSHIKLKENLFNGLGTDAR
jgi:hypothetical protein